MGLFSKLFEKRAAPKVVDEKEKKAKEIDSEYYDQVVNKYSALMLKNEKFKVFNSEDKLPYPKEIIKKALFFSMKRLEDWKKNPKIVEFMSEKKILKLAKAIGTGYVHLFFYQDDDFLELLKKEKYSWKKIPPELAQLSKKHTRDFKKHTGKEINDMEMSIALMAFLATLAKKGKK